MAAGRAAVPSGWWLSKRNRIHRRLQELDRATVHICAGPVVGTGGDCRFRPWRSIPACRAVHRRAQPAGPGPTWSSPPAAAVLSIEGANKGRDIGLIRGVPDPTRKRRASMLPIRLAITVARSARAMMPRDSWRKSRPASVNSTRRLFGTAAPLEGRLQAAAPNSRSGAAYATSLHGGLRFPRTTLTRPDFR